MAPDAFDLAGFCVGIVDADARARPGARAAADDTIVGLASSGLHANGFSLVRRALLDEAGLHLDEVIAPLERPLVDELLEPTRIYAPLVLSLARDGLVHAAAHVTGGGILENLPRALPDGMRPSIRWGLWPVPPVFELLRRHASEDDVRATFNLGIGMVLVVEASVADEVTRRAEAAGVPAWVIGSVEA